MKITGYLILSALCLTITNCGTSDKSDNDKSPRNQPEFDLAASQACGDKPSSKGSLTSNSEGGIDIEEIRELLVNNKLEGWMHGTVHKFGHYVFTYRGTSFFNHIELSMIPISAKARKVFATLKRHDKIRIGGQFADNRSPLKHLLVEKIEVIKPFKGDSTESYNYSANLENELKDGDVIYGKVHAATLNGAAVVIEYKDAVVPLYVREEHRHLTRNLFRNDIVRVEISTNSVPNRPMHISTKAGEKNAIKVVDHIAHCNDKPATLSGELVLFPESPQISFPVFALRFEDPNGIVRNWTIVNFTSQEGFSAIREKLTKAWEKKSKSAVTDRNHYLNPKIRVTVKGKMHVVSPGQANPQMLVNQPDDINIEYLD